MDAAQTSVTLPAHYRNFKELDALLRLQNQDWMLVPEFCKDPTVVLIQLENNQIFRINYHTLTALAAGLREVLKLPDSTNGLLGTEINPISLPGKPDEIILFLKWIEHPHWIPLELTESDLLNLYLFADKWICEPATDWALQRIEGLGLRASRMLGLACELGICRWVEPALRQLFYMSTYSLSQQERDEIGNNALAVISNGQLYLKDRRMGCAACPPPMSNVGFGERECPYYGIHHEKSRCARAWDLGWKDVGLRLINPEDPLQFSEAMWFIRGLRFEGVSEQCRIATIESIAPAFEVETDTYQKAIEKIGKLIRMSAYSS
ncbi:hypothetical protein BDP27DRAFT_1437715 [Rhodocollybia butyracea]|uniref:Uncharacterized protein n=1 Tax=Rhodocollybia butyracea TaxID=206335 RepID=A0A9P5P4U0_9AGAR|nr:hypothetical protein BDP27DRAFT_1437715 [Rhodocollybia butyracea]